MKIAIRLEGEPNEIAALVSELQERQSLKLLVKGSGEILKPGLDPNDVIECKELC